MTAGEILRQIVACALVVPAVILLVAAVMDAGLTLALWLAGADEDARSIAEHEARRVLLAEGER